MPATSRKAAPSKKVLERRRAVAEQRIDIERKLQGDYATIARLDAELKGIAGDAGDSFTERFGADCVTVAPPHDKEFKGDVPEVQTEAWLALKPTERKQLEKSGLIKIVPQWGKASSGRVTVKVHA